MFSLVLHEPEIPNNTGSIGRTCVALGLALHLIEPLGFDVSDKACRRAGLDYWPRLRVQIHPSLEAYLQTARPSRLWMLSTKGRRGVFQTEFASGDHFMFGKESEGLSQTILATDPDRVLTLPMVPGERSLNLSNAASVVAYEAVRQSLVLGIASVDAGGRLGWTNP